MSETHLDGVGDVSVEFMFDSLGNTGNLANHVVNRDDETEQQSDKEHGNEAGQDSVHYQSGK